MSVATSMQNPVENQPVLHKVLNLAAKTRCILCCIIKRKKYIGSVRASDNSMCVIIVTFLWMVSSQNRHIHLSHALSGCSCGICHVCYHNVSVNKTFGSKTAVKLPIKAEMIKSHSLLLTAYDMFIRQIQGEDIQL